MVVRAGSLLGWLFIFEFRVVCGDGFGGGVVVMSDFGWLFWWGVWGLFVVVS